MYSIIVYILELFTPINVANKCVENACVDALLFSEKQY